MASRSRAREQALQVLYFMDMSSTPPDTALEMFSSNFKSDPEDLIYARHIVYGVASHQGQLDSAIEKVSDHWKVSRMSRIDRNILRIGVFELAHCEDIPPAVALNEAIELGKKYGEKDTGAFVNGILDKISKERRP